MSQVYDIRKRRIYMNEAIITLLIAIVGGLIGIKLRIPAGALVCSMISVGIYNIFVSKGYIPGNFKIAAQIVLGGMIGLKFTNEAIKELKAMLVPAILILIALTGFCIFLGYLLHRITGIDLATALFSTAPGGIADMTLLSESYGADSPKVIVMHTMRLVIVVTIMPIVIKLLIKLTNPYM